MNSERNQPEELDSGEEYVEEEVTDDEDGEDENNLPPVNKAKAAGTPTDVISLADVSVAEEEMNVTEKRTPAISDVVKNAISKSPGASSSRAGPPKKATTGTITLANTGNWTEETFSKVNIVFPIIGANNETTNDLTKANRPESRYWRVDLKFNLGSETTQTIRVFNVPIPYAEGAKYGTDFVYICLPGFMAEHFAEHGKRKRATITKENSLVEDPNRWWKIANNITDKFGAGDAVKKGFRPINLQTIFSTTTKGIIANLEIKFSARCSTTESAKLTATNPQRITVELIRGYIIATDQDIELPTRVSKVLNKIKPGASAQDFASDDVMKRLRELGL